MQGLETAEARQRAIADLAREALLVQDACNLTGVVAGMGRALSRLRALLEAEGSFGNERLHRHHVTRLWADKVNALAGIQDLNCDEVSAAYNWAHAATHQASREVA